MASTQEQTQLPSPQRKWLDSLTRFQRETAYVLLGLAALFALLALYVGTKYKRSGSDLPEGAVAPELLAYIPVAVWCGLMALTCLSTGLWQLLRTREEETREMDLARLLVLTLGGLTGFVTVLLAVGLAYPWWSTISGGLEAWRKDSWRVVLCLLALFGGLAIMFLSLNLGRADERSNAALRRLVHGYNAVLTGLLLFAILGILNVLTYVPIKALGFLSTPSDWTASSINSITPASKRLLESLDKPVKVYVLLSMGDPLYHDVRYLLENCRVANPRISVEYVSPDRNRAKIEELISKYQVQFVEGIEGLLVVYGGEGKEDREFIRKSELETTESGVQNRGRIFQGEDALISKLSYLSQGKSRSVVYFTQGHGELDLKDTNSQEDNRGLAVLKERLQKGSYDVRELRLDPGTKTVPDDADVVVVARPAGTFPASALKVLRDYMNRPADKKPGKLVVLFDVVLDINKAPVKTGLEDFVKEYGVQVDPDRILNLNDPDNPTVIGVSGNATLAQRNPVAAAFARLVVPMIMLRPVQPVDSRGPAEGFHAEVLLITFEELVFKDNQFRESPENVAHALIQARNRDEIEKKLRGRLPVAVAVSADREGKPGTRGGTPQPRLAVFGNASWVANAQIEERLINGHYDLFSSTLAWLRERPEIGVGSNPKVQKAYVVDNPNSDMIWRLRLLPGMFMVLGILGLGGGIWVVRRR